MFFCFYGAWAYLNGQCHVTKSLPVTIHLQRPSMHYAMTYTTHTAYRIPEGYRKDTPPECIKTHAYQKDTGRAPEWHRKGGNKSLVKWHSET